MVVDTFQANGKQYEIRLAQNGNEIKVRAFQNSKPANVYSYSVTLEVTHDLKVLAGQDAIKELVRIAKDHVIQQRDRSQPQCLGPAGCEPVRDV